MVSAEEARKQTEDAKFRGVNAAEQRVTIDDMIKQAAAIKHDEINFTGLHPDNIQYYQDQGFTVTLKGVTHTISWK